jgi:hypothetical protein
VFNTDQKYLYLIYDSTIDVYHVPVRVNGVDPIMTRFATLNEPKLTPTIIKEMDVIQRGDVTILFHTDFQPLIITRTGYEDFELGVLEMISPQDLVGADIWTDINGWPSYATFFQGRMYCAGSKSYPLSVWGIFIADAQADAPTSPLNDTIDSDKINRITGIFSGRNLQLFTTGAEFVNRSEMITPLDSAWAIQTRYGSYAGVPFDSLDGSTFYIDRHSAVREFIYDYNQDANISNDLTTLSSNLFSNPFRIEIIKSAKDTLGRFTYVLNDDGSLAMLNFNKAEGIVAWVTLTTKGKIIDIATADNELYILVQGETEVYLERLDLSDNVTYLDSSSGFSGNRPVTVCGNEPVATVICIETVGGDLGLDFFLDKIWCGDCLMFTSPLTPPITTVTGLDRFEGEEVSIMLDDIYQGDFLVVAGEVTVDKLFTIGKVGRKFSSIIRTLPLASPQFQAELANKRIVKIKLYLYESNGFYINDEFVASEYFGTANFDLKAPVNTGVFEYWTLGWDTFSQFNIQSEDPLGFNILKYDVQVDITE